MTGRARVRMLPSGERPCTWSSNPTNTAASSTDLRLETTVLAGKPSSGQPMATQIMITWSSGMPACSRTPSSTVSDEPVFGGLQDQSARRIVGSGAGVAAVSCRALTISA